MTPRRHPPMLMRSELTGTIYIVTRYKIIDAEHGRFEAQEKYNVTGDFERIAALAGYVKP